MNYILTVGVTSLIPFEYAGFGGFLKGSKNDAVEMLDRFMDKGYHGQILIDDDTMSFKFIESINELSKRAKSGDFVVIHLSGHGGQISDTLVVDEIDGKDEYFCFSDRPMKDDEMHYLFTKFKRGVRLLVINDSCHSGTQYKTVLTNRMKNEYPAKFAPSYAVAHSAPKQTMDNILKYKAKLKCSLEYIAGCDDRAVSYDGAIYKGKTHGFLTSRVLEFLDQKKKSRVWDLVSFIKRNMPDFQKPKITRVKYWTTLRQRI